VYVVNGVHGVAHVDEIAHVDEVIMMCMRSWHTSTIWRIVVERQNVFLFWVAEGENMFLSLVAEGENVLLSLVQGGEGSQKALSLQVIFRKRAT